MDTLRIALIGYGKMGQAIERWAPTLGVELVSRTDPSHPHADFDQLCWDAVADADVCIEFSTPTEALGNCTRLMEWNKALVSGTTGWDAELSRFSRSVEERQGTLCHSSNFSLGALLFSQILESTAGFLKNFPGYALALHEEHHQHKLDQPSGTALHLAQVLEKKTGRSVPTSSLRCGEIPGTHQLVLEGVTDSLRLTHTARSREGFALGALEAAKRLKGRQGVFRFEDLILGA
jgi:4-hydroxy-tetrahydrodipicolinate reductase